MTINIYNRNYQIDFKDKVIVNDDDCAGGCFYEEARLEIAYRLKDELKYKVIAHEITHACLFESGLSNMFSEKEAETICDLVGSVYNIMRQNADKF